MTREEHYFANGVVTYWDSDTGQMGIKTTKRGHRYLEKRAKKKGLTVEEYVRQALTDSLQGVGANVDHASFTVEKGDH
jgi:hypothetical protein